jgi:hypothetical protein
MSSISELLTASSVVLLLHFDNMYAHAACTFAYKAQHLISSWL